jgi:hypothetical protein
MTPQLWAALLLNVGAVAGAMLARVPRWNLSPMSRQIGPILLLLALPASLFAIYLFVQTRGWGYGFLAWFGSGGVSVMLLRFLFEGLRTIAGIAAIVAGGALYFYS